MMSGILNPAFLQSAGRAGKGEPVGKIILDIKSADPIISSISCTGEIKVTTIKNGSLLVETYNDLNGDTLSIQADANTQIIISGAEITACEIGENVVYTKISVKNNTLTQLNCGSCYVLTDLDLSKNSALTTLSCSSCYALTDLDLSKNTALAQLDCGGCYALTDLDLSKNTALEQLNCGDCYALTDLDLSKNTALATLHCDSCAKLVSISYPATNEDVSTAVASAITNADSATGTVYTDSEGAYYSTIATAATTKGWTIQQLPA